MSELKFESGLKVYRVNDACDIAFNPTDDSFIERLYAVFSELDAKQEQRKAEIAKNADTKEIFELARRYDTEMREMIDGLFDAPVCEKVFGNMSTGALAGGFPVWANLLLAIMDEVDASFVQEQKMTNSRVTKYTSKYKAK